MNLWNLHISRRFDVPADFGGLAWRLGVIALVVMALPPRQRTAGLPDERPAQGAAVSPTSAAASFGNLPLRFERNIGQTDAEVRFVARGAGYTLFLTDREAVMSLAAPRSNDRAAVLRWTLEDAAAGGVRPDGVHPLAGTQHYYVGGADRWRTNVPGYSAVRYSAIYPGIDLIYHATHRELEYDFVVAPGADSDRIAIAITGADAMAIDDAGDLILRVGTAEIRQPRPTVFQNIDGGRREVKGAYVLEGHRVGFEIGDYDRTHELVIDPVVTLGFSTFLGGSSAENGVNAGIAVDPTGHVYITGETSSVDFPTVDAARPALAGQYDIYVAKLDPTGSALVYATYIGSRDADEGQDIDVDAEGFAYVSGFTNSIAFPILNAFQPAYGGGIGDAVVIKLAPDGSLVYSTYLGGQSGFPDRSYERGHAIATDGRGSAFVAGLTSSQNFPTTPGAHRRTSFGIDAFVTKLGPTGALMYSTYVGGRSHDEAYGIAVDAAGHAYVTGYTMSVDNPASPSINEAFPLVNAVQPVYGGGFNDGFVFKLSADGSTLLYSTYLGGSGVENQSPNLVGTTGDIAVDAEGYAYVAGQTNSVNFPTTPGAIKSAPAQATDPFVVKLSPDGGTRLYSTLVGGINHDRMFGIAIDSAGYAYITGNSPGAFPQVNALPSSAAMFRNIGWASDAFIARLNQTGTALSYSTYLGGNGVDVGLSIAVDRHGAAYVVGQVSGGHPSAPFPTTPGAFQTTMRGTIDAFVAKLSAPNSPPLAADDSYTVDEDTILETLAPGVLANDRDADGSTLTVELVDTTTHGTLAINDDGSFVYSPSRDFHGSDRFTYRAHDGEAASSLATVLLTVNPINDAPVATGEDYILDEDTRVSVQAPGLVGNDTDTDSPVLSAILMTTASHGALALGGDGSFVYTPAANYHGSDFFTYKVSDGALESEEVTVLLTINPINDAPVAMADSAVMAAASMRVAVNVLANDSDVDGDRLIVSAVSAGADGTVVINADGTVTYTSKTPTLSVLIAQVEALAAADDGGSLMSKLVAARQSFRRRQLTAGRNQLGAFANHVAAMKRSRRLNPAIADALIAIATALTDDVVRPPDQFTYTISDGAGGVATAIVFVTFEP